MSGIKVYGNLITEFLRQQNKTIENVKNRKELYKYFIAGHFAIIICSAIYGAGMGVFAGGIWILFDAIKMPLIILITLYISLPIFYIIDVYSGSEIEFSQCAVFLLSSFSIMAINMSAFTPVVFFFGVTTPNIPFIVLLNTCICGFSGLSGLLYLFRCYQIYYKDKDKKWYPSMFIGSFIVAFVGTQLAWCLRPYFHQYDRFIEPIKSNFYVEVAGLAVAEPVVAAVLVTIFSIVTILIFTTSLFLKQKSIPEKPTPVSTPIAPPYIQPAYTQPIYPIPSPEHSTEAPIHTLPVSWLRCKTTFQVEEMKKPFKTKCPKCDMESVIE